MKRTLRELSDDSGIPYHKIERWVARGHIAYTQFDRGRRRYVEQSDFDFFIDRYGPLLGVQKRSGRENPDARWTGKDIVLHPPTVSPPILRRKEVARFLGITERAVGYHLEWGNIKGISHPFTKEQRYNAEEVIRFANVWRKHHVYRAV